MKVEKTSLQKRSWRKRKTKTKIESKSATK